MQRLFALKLANTPEDLIDQIESVDAVAKPQRRRCDSVVASVSELDD